jgi:hypothetical protein
MTTDQNHTATNENISFHLAISTLSTLSMEGMPGLSGKKERIKHESNSGSENVRFRHL